jgi:hypothetical protein
MQSDLRAVVEDKSRWGTGSGFKIDEHDFTVIRPRHDRLTTRATVSALLWVGEQHRHRTG